MPQCVLVPDIPSSAGRLPHSAGCLKPPILMSLPVFLPRSLSFCVCLSLCLSLICPKLKACLHSRNLPAYSLLIGLEQGHSTDLVQEAAFEAGWYTCIHTHTHTHTHTQTHAVSYTSCPPSLFPLHAVMKWPGCDSLLLLSNAFYINEVG